MIIFKKPNEKINYKFKLKMNGHLLQQSNSIKYLGIYLDSSLNRKHHCDLLSKTLKRANGMLMKIRHYVQKKDLKSIYHALFSSHLSYGCQIWGQVKNIHTEHIFKLQNRAQRIMDFADLQAEVNPIYKSNKTLKLKDQITIQNSLLVYDFFNRDIAK